MAIEHDGRTIETDSEGFLLDQSDWDEQLMEEMAAADGLELTDAHRTVINAVRDYYQQYAATPPMRGLIALLKKKGRAELASSAALARMFPKGAAKSAARYAGLPKPARCI